MILRAAQEPDGCDESTLPSCAERSDDRRCAYHIYDVVGAAPAGKLTDFNVPLRVIGVEAVGRTEPLRNLELLGRGR